MLTTPEPDSVKPSRTTFENPVNAYDTEYVPGGKSVMRYWPDASVVVLRIFSMRAGLLASTVTPGNTRPDASRTTPASDVCPCATTGTKRITKRKNDRVISLIETPFHECCVKSRTAVRSAPKMRDILHPDV